MNDDNFYKAEIAKLKTLIRFQETRISNLESDIADYDLNLEKYKKEVSHYMSIVDAGKNSGDFAKEWNHFMSFVKLFADEQEVKAMGG
jgi:hypothetical protein